MYVQTFSTVYIPVFSTWNMHFSSNTGYIYPFVGVSEHDCQFTAAGYKPVQIVVHVIALSNYTIAQVPHS